MDLIRHIMLELATLVDESGMAFMVLLLWSVVAMLALAVAIAERRLDQHRVTTMDDLRMLIVDANMGIIGTALFIVATSVAEIVVPEKSVYVFAGQPKWAALAVGLIILEFRRFKTLQQRRSTERR